MSEKTVAQKLMIKPGKKVWLVNPPENYAATLGPLPAGAELVQSGEEADVVQLFVRNREEMEAQLPQVTGRLRPGTLLWVSYYKGTARVKTDIHRDSLNAFGKSLGLEGIFIISVDEDWSALRFKQV